MKSSNIITIMIMTLLIVGCKTEKNQSSKEEGYKVSGTIIGIDKGTLTSNKDTITIKNGSFTLTGKVEGTINQYYRINNKYGFTFLLSNETFKIAIDINKADERGRINDIEVTGSPTNDEFKKVSDYLQSTPEAKKLETLYNQGKTLENGSDAYKKHYEAISEAREASNKVRAAYIKDYALKNPHSVTAAYYMGFQANEVDQTFEEFEQIVEGFSDEVKKSSFYKPLKNELEALKRVSIGNVAPDFTLKTNKGQDFTLSSLRGKKIVLIDFWASWCVPCRKSYPHLKEVYNKYKDQGFEIVAVTNDYNHEQWKKAIEEDGLEWIQVADVFPPRDQGPPFTAKVITAYAAPFLPSTYLLDKEGKIIAKQLHGDALDQRLEEIFSEASK